MTTNDNGGHEIPLTPPPAGPPANAAAPDGAAAGAPRPAPESEPRPDPAPVPGPTSRPASGAGRPIGIVLAVVGGIALVGSGTTAAFAAGSQLSQHDSVITADADGITGLDLEIGASSVTVEFGDVDRAELRVDSARGGSWTLERDEDELLVRSPNRTFGWWFGGWFDDDDETVVLTLPEELQGTGLDADLNLGAGSLDVSGEFGEVDVVVGAGALSLDGSATAVDAEINAGRADIELADVREADLTVAAGRLVAELTGSVPDVISFDVMAGSLELTVPDAVYDVTQEVSAGEFDNRVETSTTASSTVDATVSAGTAILRPGD
ncbi:DUF4097 domain-containing protein [Microbacterium sp. CIAB417]|uniref:DUF4097 domain-containing protein n=1 Tax=Microbacterium sp. CIAB417 TaxID=2860287 RepID=UPI001FADAE1C|nr:DUF4097 domain-containing protein [Microbacterium sp. CIAB417]